MNESNLIQMKFKLHVWYDQNLIYFLDMCQHVSLAVIMTL